jgi:excisionase family DNA binding protein
MVRVLETEEVNEFGYCDLHKEPVDEGTYEYKGCWGCYHFHRGKDFPYMSVTEASEELGVSESTIRRWIRKGKLKGRLFVQGRYSFGSLPSPPKYHIEKESVKELKKQMESSKR